MLFLYKNELNYRIISEIIDIISTRPSWWIIFNVYIINNKRITYKKDTTFIISIYNMKDNHIVILYNILKRFYIIQVISKVIYKKEFVIVHLKDEECFKIMSDLNYWKECVVYYLINKNGLILKRNYFIKVYFNEISLYNNNCEIVKKSPFSYYIPFLLKRIKQLLEINKTY